MDTETTEMTSVITETLNAQADMTEPNEEIVELDKEIQKPKKPRTEKQIEALKKAQLKRSENLKLKKLKEEEIRKAIADNEKYINEPPEPSQVKQRTRKKKPTVVYEDDPSSDEEIIVVKRRKGKKKPKKKIVYEESSSSSEEEELQKQKSVAISEDTDEYDSDDYSYEKEYSYPVNRPLKYSDVFTFSN